MDGLFVTQVGWGESRSCFAISEEEKNILVLDIEYGKF